MDDARRTTSILVVDDTIENLRLLESMLGEQGYEVRPVTSGRLALSAATHDPPDLILLDITMPDMDGFEVCRRLKALDAVKDVPVIFLTALNETAHKVKAFDAGGIDYITKPFQMEEVLARVHTHVALRRASLELQRNYERLQNLERLRDDLVHMVVHDMRSPLMVLTMHLDFLRGEAAHVLSGQATEDLEAAVRGAGSLTRMANDLIDVSRLEDGKMPVQRGACDAAQIAEDVRAALGRWDRGRTIGVDARGPIEITCDRGLVFRVLENLVNNAIKHTPSEGRIEIAVARTEGQVRISVADEGRGVPRDAREKIFEKFGAVATRHGQQYHSAGLGLAFCKLAVEAHGGTIGVDDREPHGSTFWFELPA